ncbi:Nn.00g048220.m01.CDS01 [Neocucurbitaria sp. VM-36]
MSTDKAEKAVAFAALILADESIIITPEKLQILLKAAGIEDVEPIWTTLLANALKDKNVKEIVTTVADSDPAAGGVGADSGEKNNNDDLSSSLDGRDDDGIDIDGDSDDDFGMDLFG